tara:strand:+ start:55 stop:357 length:303 start_codon:yes stop_codon:yes gene_type:complete
MAKFINIVCCQVNGVPADVYILGIKLLNIARSGLICVLKQQTVNLRKNKVFASTECTGKKNIISAISILGFLDDLGVSPERVFAGLGLPDTMMRVFLFET